MKGRKRNKVETEPHCYMIFKADVAKMEKNGWAPKEVMRLGILSKEGNPQMLERIRDVEENHASMQEKFQRIARRNLELKQQLDLMKTKHENEMHDLKAGADK